MAVVYKLDEVSEVPRRAPCLTARFPPSQIRNICIIAHVDHGKTTLTDAILKRGGVLPEEGREVGTFTDKLTVEKERGITVKSQCTTFFVRYDMKPSATSSPSSPAQPERKSSSTVDSAANSPTAVDSNVYCINLIDTPGHVDFSFEVARCLHATEGAVLLIDANQGVEAQSVANLYLAVEANQAVIPALSKLDSVMNEEQVIGSLSELENITGISSTLTVMTAARMKRGIEDLLKAIIDRVPPPTCDREAQFRGLVIDSWLDTTTTAQSGPAAGGGGGDASDAASSAQHRLTLLVKITEGVVRRRDVVALLAQDQRFTVVSVGIMYPDQVPVGELVAGQVGFLTVTSLPLTAQQLEYKRQRQGQSVGVADPLASAAQAGQQRLKHITGDTVFALQSFGRDAASGMRNFELKPPPKPVHEFRPIRPVVFVSYFPDEGCTFDGLAAAIGNLTLNEPSVTVQETKCPSLGRGLVIGFSGQLQAEVFQQRLSDEHDTAVLVTPAQVFFRYKDRDGTMHDLTTENWLERHEGAVEYYEPITKATIITPVEHHAEIIGLANEFRAEVEDSTPLDDGKRVTVRLRIPLADLVRGFFSEMKARTHGYASLEQSDPIYEPADLVMISVLINKARIAGLATICVRQHSQQIANRIVAALKDNITQAIVMTPIQAYIGQKCICSDRISARRKDVAAKVKSGGDASRKQKQLQNQKKSKAKIAARMLGKFSLDSETLLAVRGAHRL